jgi:hypothetical protein
LSKPDLGALVFALEALYSTPPPLTH